MDATVAHEAALAAAQIMADLAHRAAAEDDPVDDPAACAAMMLMACEAPSCLDDRDVAELLARARRRLEASFDPARGFVALPSLADTRGSNAATQPATAAPGALTRAMIACAWARALAAGVEALAPPPRATVRAAIDAAWSALPEAQRIALLPWLGWAELDYARATSSTLAHADALRGLRQAIASATVNRQRYPHAQPDVLGGLFVSGNPGDEYPLPSAQSVRTALWLVVAAGEPTLTPPDQIDSAWAQCREALRFICQLQATDARASASRNAARTLGGLSASPWDGRQPLAAQAMGLLLASEALNRWPDQTGR